MTAPTFVKALRQMLLDAESPVEWSPDGLRVRVKKPFEPCVHMTGTTSRKYSTFVRQLNNHGFRSVVQNVWCHEHFSRDKPNNDHLIVPVRRRVRFSNVANSNVGAS